MGNHVTQSVSLKPYKARDYNFIIILDKDRYKEGEFVTGKI